MVILHNPEMATGKTKADFAPVMHRHHLTATKNTRSFKAGDFSQCFITKMTCGRFAVMSADFLNFTKHYEVFNADELQESFNEFVPTHSV
jgi:hypothetical protein